MGVVVRVHARTLARTGLPYGDNSHREADRFFKAGDRPLEENRSHPPLRLSHPPRSRFPAPEASFRRREASFRRREASERGCLLPNPDARSDRS